MTTLQQHETVRVRVPRRTIRVRLAGIVLSAPAVPASGRDRRRRAKFSIGLGLVMFLAIQFGLGWSVHTERVPLRDPVYFDKLAQLRNRPAFFQPRGGRAATLLFVGSSRTLNAVDARAASAQLSSELGEPVEAFNFGQAGAGPITNAVYLRRLIQDGAKPDFAMIEVHPTFLAGQRPDPPETRWLLPIRLRPDELPVVRAMGFPASDPAVHGPRGLLAPAFEYRFLILDRYAPWFLMTNKRLNGGHESDDFGFTRLPDGFNESDRTYLKGLAFGQYEYYFAGYRPNGCGVNGLRDSLDVCRAKGIRPALVLMPETRTWMEWYDAEGLKELGALMSRLGAEYDVPVIDGRSWAPDERTVDGHHLCGSGADLFTRRLVRDAVAPWMKGQRTSP